MASKRPSRIRLLRFTTQLTSFILLNAALIGITFNLVVPFLHPFSSPLANAGGAFELLLKLAIDLVIPFIPLAVFLIIAAIFGRAFCGWACPFGFVQDLLGMIPVKKRNPSKKNEGRFSEIKFFILGFTIILTIWVVVSKIQGSELVVQALGPFAESPFEPLSPATTLFALIPWMIIRGTIADIFSGNILLWLRLGILVGVLITVIYIPRAWCRWFCPAGAILGIFSRNSFLGIKRRLTKCTTEKCQMECEAKCPMAIRIMQEPWKRIRHHNCTLCLNCKSCPEDAIEMTAP
ncbi:MAG: 4Fe-4S binding protein [Candidatus Hodarchaeota archaeon]